MGWLSSLVGGVVGFFVGGPVGAVIGAGIGATKVGEKVVNTVLDFVTQPFMPKIPDVSADSAERQQGFELQREGSDKSIPVVYGYRKVGGVVTFLETGSTDNKYLYVAYVFSEGLVEGLREVFIDDNPLPNDIIASLNGGNLVNITAGSYKDRVQLRWYPGTYFSNPNSSTVGSTVKGDIFASAPSFKSNMNYNGLAVLFARFEYKKIVTQADSDANPFKGSTPVVQVTMLGKRVASLLVDNTETSGYDSNPVRYSTNPAECLLDYLRNPRYGKGLTNDDIDWTSWKIAARKCNQTVTYVASGISGPILTMNGVVDTSGTIMNNTKLMLQNFRAYMPYVQGKYKLKIEDAGNPTDITSGAAVIQMSFTKDDIVSDITYGGIDRSAKYNVVSVTYIDPDQAWSPQSVIYPETEAERQAYIDKDGGRENKYDVTYGYVTNYAIAKDMARLIFNKQRRQETCVFTATSKALELEPGDCVRIQSNILNFGTDPWRVVSIKINNDMTVDLGCVRNPDDIYPYARVGEEDIVEPPYIPKGSIIFYPSSQNLPPLGLVPPQYAVYPTVVVSTPVTPPPTDPLGPSGGGVGGGSGGSSTSTTNPVDTSNNTATTPPPPPPFDAVLTYKSLKWTKVTTDTGSFVITFTQPSSAFYSYSILWWRLNQFNPWVAIRIEDKPGAGGDISVNIGTLPNLGSYDYYVRSYDTSDTPSINVTKGNVAARINGLGVMVGIGSGSPQAAGPGWELPASQTPVNPWWNDTADFIELRPILSGGNPSNPRKLKLNMTKMQYALANSATGAVANPLISGVLVYYKYKDDTYWQLEELPVPADVGWQYSPQTWDLTGSFGAAVWPSVPANDYYNYPGLLQQYDFVIRFKYSDGKTAEKQMSGRGPVEVFVTGSPTQWDFSVIGTSPYSATPASWKDSAGTTLQLASQQDPATVYNTAQDLVPVFDTPLGVWASSTTSQITFRFKKPSSTKFLGYNIRYREVIAGADPTFKLAQVGTISDIAGIISYPLSGDYKHSTKYEWMISVRYQDTITNTEKDATNCWYGRASIPFNLPSSQDLISGGYLNLEQKATATVLNDLDAPFPATGTIVPQKWIKKQLAIQTGTTFLRDWNVKRDAAGQARLNAWYQLQFLAPNQTFTNLVVYRRTYTATYNATTLYGLGPWEKVVIPRTSLTHLGNGVYTVDLRGPIDYTYFSSTSSTAVNAAYGATGNWPYTGYTPYALSTMYPYFGTGNNTTSGYRAEYLIVLDDGGEGTKGVRLPDFNTDVNNALGKFAVEVDGFQSANVAKDDYKTVSDFNNLTVGTKRNINEAITATITSYQLAAGLNPTAGYPKTDANYTTWPTTNQVIAPSGVTIY